MPVIYVATSKANQEWGADVGLGKSLFKVGVTDDEPERAVAGFAGQTDWKVLKTEPVDLSEDDIIARLERREKAVDPAYYPKLRGGRGLFKVTIANVENQALVALALDGNDPPKGFKIKPADVAKYLITNALR